jgi:hypothetical protein
MRQTCLVVKWYGYVGDSLEMKATGWNITTNFFLFDSSSEKLKYLINVYRFRFD